MPVCRSNRITIIRKDDSENFQKQTAMRECSLKKFLFVLWIAAFGLNMLWELAQVFAFSSLAEVSAFEIFILVTIASIADALITLAAYFVVALIRRERFWWKAVGAADYLIFALVGIISATLIETIALSRGTWTYGEYMPIIPLLKIGLLPFLQLTVLLPAALLTALRWCGHK
jgi:hypothetical protein